MYTTHVYLVLLKMLAWTEAFRSPTSAASYRDSIFFISSLSPVAVDFRIQDLVPLLTRLCLIIFTFTTAIDLEKQNYNTKNKSPKIKVYYVHTYPTRIRDPDTCIQWFLIQNLLHKTIHACFVFPCSATNLSATAPLTSRCSLIAVHIDERVILVSLQTKVMRHAQFIGSLPCFFFRFAV